MPIQEPPNLLAEFKKLMSGLSLDKHTAWSSKLKTLIDILGMEYIVVYSPPKSKRRTETPLEKDVPIPSLH